MIVDISGDIPDYIEKQFFYKETEYLGKILLNDEYNKVFIKLIFINNYKKNYQRYAHCIPVTKNWFTFTTPRNFIIEIDSHLSRKQFGLSLAHEMVHIQQIYQGFLKLPPYHSKMSWCGIILDMNRPEAEQPHEIEAKGREEYLYENFLKIYDKGV